MKLTGRLAEGATATDLVLTVTEMLRKRGVVEKFVEFFGDGLAQLPLADRATIANMAPEYGATCGIFPIDDVTLDYLRLTGRAGDADCAGARIREGTGPVAHGRRAGSRTTRTCCTSTSSSVQPSLAGPKRPQDRVALGDMQDAYRDAFSRDQDKWKSAGPAASRTATAAFELKDGAVVIAAITSCTNTSNPAVMIGAALVARNARSRGLTVQAVGQDLARSRLEGRDRVPAALRN